jgi:hypothetical protein
MMLDVVSLHLNDSTYRQPLDLPAGSSKANGAMPSIRHLSQELMDMVSDGPEQGQRYVERAVRIGPLLGPDFLRLRPIPIERELDFLVPERCLDAYLPEIISID